MEGQASEANPVSAEFTTQSWRFWLSPAREAGFTRARVLDDGKLGPCLGATRGQRVLKNLLGRASVGN